MEQFQYEDMMQSIQKINDFIIKSEMEKAAVHKSQKDLMQKAREMLAAMGKKEERILQKIEKAFKSHEMVLEKMLAVMTSADESLCNVLFAINQNEYLKAWYPAQNGQPEQKAVGKYAIAEKQVKKA